MEGSAYKINFDLGDGSAVFGDATGTQPGGTVLAASSTTKAFAPPRMTSAQMEAISSPVSGAMVYNESSGALYFYSGSAWGAV